MNTNHRVCRATLCGLAAAAALSGFTATARAMDDALPTQIVRYGDLDITKPTGAKVLYERIRIAAREVCEQPSRFDLASGPRAQDCIERAIDQAVKKIDAVALTELRFGPAPRLARQP